MKKAFAIFPIGFCIIFLLEHQSRAATHKIFSSMTYYTSSPDLAEKIILANGSGVVWRHRLHAYLYYGNRYALGDFNEDGRKDAAVIIGESQSATGDEVELAFLIHDGKQLVHQQTIYLGNHTTVHSLKERDGKVIVDMFVHQRGDCQAGPTKRVIARYDFLNPPPDEVAFPRPIPE